MNQPERLARELVDAAFELHRRRLWLELPEDAPILVRVPAEPHPLVATITGHAGGIYGIYVTRGEEALAQFARHVTARVPDTRGLDTFGFGMELLGGVAPELRDVLRAAGVRARADSAVPVFVAKPRGSDALRPLERSEQRVLLAVIRAILLAHDAGELRVAEFDARARRLLEITVDGEGRETSARTRHAKVELPRPSESAGAGSLPADLPRLEQRWVAGVVHEDDDDPEDAELSVVVVHAETRTPLARAFWSAGEPDAVATLFTALARGEREGQPAGVPCEVLFADARVHAQAAPLLEPLGVRCELVERHELIDECASGLRRVLEKLHSGDEDHDARGEDALPTLLHEWMEADLRVGRRLLEALAEEREPFEAAAERFFGGREIADEVLATFEAYQPIASFAEWRMRDDRPTARSKSFLERRLAREDLSPVERALVETRLAARLSIYRVRSVRPGESLEIEDVFDGARFTVHDRTLSGCDVVGVCLPLRVRRVGDWLLIAMGGPPLTATSVPCALDFLESAGVELSPAGLQRAPQVLGRLWQTLLELQRSPPTFANTDGDPILLQTATFRLADPAAVARGLGGRPDVRHDPERCVWTWFRRGSAVPAFGENTKLGSIEIHDDRLVLEVNSASRFARARAWLQALPGGVRFERSTTREIDLGSGGGPLDDRLPETAEPASPEGLALLERACRDAGIAWLDRRVPSLGGRTPREVARTEAGRRRVAVLIRAMPSSTSPDGPLEPPREELLRELGIPVRG